MSDAKNLSSEIHKLVAAYSKLEHNFEFDPQAPVIRLHEPTFGSDEINAAISVLLSTRVTMGPKVKEFERSFSQKYTHSFGVMNNSGSSANLLAVAALTNPVTEGRLRPGDEVIVPALSWSTTLWPLIQCGLVPVIVDIDPKTFNIDPNEVERAISPKTRGLMPVHVYGNPCDMDALTAICDKHDLVMIEDCCEALGASYKQIPVGKFGRVGTFSFYFSHHMTTLEGGMCVTDDFKLSELMRILRAHGWVREVDDPAAYLEKYPEFDPRFLFVNLGYNLRATELQAVIGSVQLPKLPSFVDSRRLITRKWQTDLAKFEGFFDFQAETENGFSSCFGFPLIRKTNAPFELRSLNKFLNSKNIETRPIICGNIARQPAMKMFEHKVVGDLKHSTNVMQNGFSFGNHQSVGEVGCEYVTSVIEEFFRQHT
jgi:CDP-6-deoxy-D-xylo-4-hexulose-3-dehydrase